MFGDHRVSHKIPGFHPFDQCIQSKGAVQGKKWAHVHRSQQEGGGGSGGSSTVWQGSFAPQCQPCSNAFIDYRMWQKRVLLRHVCNALVNSPQSSHPILFSTGPQNHYDNRACPNDSIKFAYWCVFTVFFFFFNLFQVKDCSRDALHSIYRMFRVCRLLALYNHILVQVELPLNRRVLWLQQPKTFRLAK